MSTLRFATWNIHGGRRLEEIASGLRTLNADIIALQEVDAGWGERSDWRDVSVELAGHLMMRAAYGPTLEVLSGRQKRRYGLAILSRWPIIDNHLTPLGPSGDWNPGDHETEPRAALEAMILSPIGRVRAISAHLSPHMLPPGVLGSSTRTRAQAEDLAALLARGAAPTLLGVDLNAGPESPEFAALTASGRFTALPTSGLPTWPTSDYRWGDAVAMTAETGLGIDWIIADQHFRGDGALVTELEGSDHRAVVADFSLEA